MKEKEIFGYVQVDGEYVKVVAQDDPRYPSNEV